MKTLSFTILIFLASISLSHGKIKGLLLHGVNGGSDCATCTAIVGIVEEVSIVYNETVDATLERLCKYLPSGLFRLTCQEAIQEFGPIIISGYN